MDATATTTASADGGLQAGALAIAPGARLGSFEDTVENAGGVMAAAFLFFVVRREPLDLEHDAKRWIALQTREDAILGLTAQPTPLFVEGSAQGGLRR